MRWVLVMPRVFVCLWTSIWGSGNGIRFVLNPNFNGPPRLHVEPSCTCHVLLLWRARDSMYLTHHDSRALSQLCSCDVGSKYFWSRTKLYFGSVFQGTWHFQNPTYPLFPKIWDACRNENPPKKSYKVSSYVSPPKLNGYYFTQRQFF